MRRKDIDLIKYLACLLIVVLHAIKPGEGIQQYVYLIGVYGIPLFLVVNGYLLAYKEFSFKYLLKKFYLYFRFILMWGIIIGLLFSLKEKNIFVVIETICGIFLGKGHLYQLWFLIGLLMIYVICFLLDYFKINRFKIFGSKCSILVILIIQTIFFFINIILKNIVNIEIREIIIPTLRIVTNGSFFFIGSWIKYNEIEVVKYKKYYYLSLLLSYILTCAISNLLDITWASSLYDLLFVSFGTISVFGMIVNSEVNNKFIVSQINKSTGIWICHPLILMLLDKCFKGLGMTNIVFGICSYFICIIISSFIVIICNKNRILKKLFEI